LRTGNHLLVRGCRQIDGYAGLEPRKRLDYRQLAALQAASVQWVVNRPDTREIAGLLEHDRHWLRVPDPLPRVRLENKAGQSWPHAPREEAHHAERDVNYGDAQLLEERPGELLISVRTTEPCLLVVADSFHRGWQATIDGQMAEVLRAGSDFLGCKVEPGQHRVRLSFQPTSLLWGRRLSLLGLLTIGMGFVLLARKTGEKANRAARNVAANLEQELAHV
jgi:hypothetical protein